MSGVFEVLERKRLYLAGQDRRRNNTRWEFDRYGCVAHVDRGFDRGPCAKSGLYQFLLGNGGVYKDPALLTICQTHLHHFVEELADYQEVFSGAMGTHHDVRVKKEPW